MKASRLTIACSATVAGVCATAAIATFAGATTHSSVSMTSVNAQPSARSSAGIVPEDGEVMTPSVPTVIAARQARFGPSMADGHGNTVYVFSADKVGQSNCNGTCARTWIPVVSQGGKPHAGPGFLQQAIGSIQRADGSDQVTFFGFPLYYYIADTAPGDAKGHGVSAFGGVFSASPPSSNKGGHPTPGRPS